MSVDLAVDPMKPLPSSTRVRLAVATAVVILVATYLASWVATGRVGAMHHPFIVRAVGGMESIQLKLAEYLDAHGEYPASLRDLAISDASRDAFVRDPWGQPFRYARTDAAFELYSLGRDGRSGGRGLDADIYAGDEAALETRLPLVQFVFQTTGSFTLLVVAVLASVCSGAVSYLSTSPRKTDLITEQRLSRNLVIQVVSAAVIALFFALFYITAAQSGH